MSVALKAAFSCQHPLYTAARELLPVETGPCPGPQSPETGAWSLDPRAWSFEPGAWNLEPGAWSLEPGPFTLHVEGRGCVIQ